MQPSSSTLSSASSLASEMLREWTLLTAIDTHTAPPLANVVPDAWQLYRLGVLLSQLPTTTALASSSSSSSTAALTSVRQASHALLVSLPDNHRATVFRDLHQALLQAVQLEEEEEEETPDDGNHGQGLVREAVQAVAQLYVAANDVAPTAMDWDDDDDLAALVVGVHRRLPSTGGDGRVDESNRALWTLLSRILWTGSFPEDLLRIVHAAGAGSSDDDVPAAAAAWRDFCVWQDERDDQWRSRLVLHYFGDNVDESEGGESDVAQRDYVLGLLQPNNAEDLAVRWNSPVLHAPVADALRNDPVLAADAPKRELRRRIDQVRQILPHLGEGFVEAALSCYQGDVAATLAALLEDDALDGTPNRSSGSALPEVLQVLDRSLPRRRDANDGNTSDAGAAKEWTKAAIAASHAEAESAAAAVDLVLRASSSSAIHPRDEYDDDYDDQYDDTEPFLADDGQTYDAVLTYNRVARQAEGDRRFWDKQRNTNRPPQQQQQQQQQQRYQSQDDEGGEEEEDDDGSGHPRFRGPDKMRGGRVPRPASSSAGRGGGERSGGREGGSTSLGAPQRARGGRGRGRKAPPQAQAPQQSAGEGSDDPAPGPGRGGAGRRSARHKDAVMSRRRDRQKQASAKKAM